VRLREFKEPKQRLDELAPFVIAGWAATVGLGAWQAYDTWKDVQKYNNSAKTEADVLELQASIGMDALAILVGGAVGKVAGKVIGKSIALGATPFKAVVNIYKKQKAAKEAAKLAKDAAKKAEKTAPRPGAKNLKPDPKVVKPKPSTAAGSGVAKKAKDLKKSPGDKAGGAAVAKTAKNTLTKRAGQAVTKTGKKALAPAAGALLGKAALDKFDKAGEYGSALKDYLGKAMDYEPSAPKKTGKLVYTGSEKNPPVKDFDPGGLGFDYEKKQAPKPKTIDSKTMKKSANPFKALTKQALAKTDLDDTKKKEIAKQVLKQKRDET